MSGTEDRACESSSTLVKKKFIRSGLYRDIIPDNFMWRTSSDGLDLAEVVIISSGPLVTEETSVVQLDESGSSGEVLKIEFDSEVVNVAEVSLRLTKETLRNFIGQLESCLARMEDVSAPADDEEG